MQLIAPGRTAAAAGARAAASASRPTARHRRRSRADAGPVDQGPTLIALAFHRLSPDGARPGAIAPPAAMSMGRSRPTTSPACSSSTPGCRRVQTFTTDRRKVADAVEKVARTQTTTFTRQMPFASVYGDASPDVSPTASAESVGRPANDSGFQARPRQSTMTPAQQAEDALRRMAERMENAYEEMMRDRNGHAETAALTALASSMGQLPGRKTVVFFSEGLSVPAAIEAKFRAVIETANRSNVSFYTVDAKGLKVHSEQAATARGLAALRGIGDDDPAVVEDNDKTAGPHHRPRAQRVPAAQGSGRGARHAGQGDRRVPDRQHQRSRLGLPAHRCRPALPLPAHLHAAQHQPGRVVPPDRGQGEAAAGRACGRAAATSRCPRSAPCPCSASSRTRCPRSPRRRGRPGSRCRRRQLRVPRAGGTVADRAVREGARQRRRLLRRRSPDDLPDAFHDPRAHRRRQGRGRPQGQPALSLQRRRQGRPRRAPGRHPVLPAADPRARALRRRVRAVRRAERRRRHGHAAARRAARGIHRRWR